MPQTLLPLPPRRIRPLPELKLALGPEANGSDLHGGDPPPPRLSAVRHRPPDSNRRANTPSGPSALAVALTLARMPSLRQQLRRKPLPRGTRLLFEIAADKSEVVRQAVSVTGKDPHFLKAAAIFYIEEVLWCRDADAYRVLGLNPGVSLEVVRKNFDVLLDWLANPADQQNRGQDLGRISFAWQAISGKPGLPSP